MSGIPNPVLDPADTGIEGDPNPLDGLPAVDETDLGLDAEQAVFLEAFKSLSADPDAANSDPDADAGDAGDEVDPVVTDPAAVPAITDPAITDPTVTTAPIVDPTATPAVAPLIFGGQTYESAHVERALGVAAYIDSLPPTAIQAFDAVLSGDYVLVPRGQASAPGAPAPTPAPGTDPTANPLEEEWTDPRAAAEIARLNTQIANVNQNVQSLAQSENQRQQDALNQAIVDSAATFATTHSLTPAQLQRIQQSAIDMQIIPGLMRTTPGGPGAVFARALEVAAWQDTEFRELKTASQIQQQTDVDRAAHVARQAKKNRAGSVASAGGAGSKATAVPPKPTGNDRQSQIQAMADMITQSGGEA